MKGELLRAQQGSRTYVIEQDLPEIGAYLRIYEDGRDIADYLQDSIEDCKAFALEEFDVSTESWNRIKELDD